MCITVASYATQTEVHYSAPFCTFHVNADRDLKPENILYASREAESDIKANSHSCPNFCPLLPSFPINLSLHRFSRSLIHCCAC